MKTLFVYICKQEKGVTAMRKKVLITILILLTLALALALAGCWGRQRDEDVKK